MVENIDFVPPSEPWELFKTWFDLAVKNELNDANAMSVATVDSDDKPSVRILLLKGYDNSGFTFFTNRQSRKGKQLHAHQAAALCWHWKSLRRQIGAEGHVVHVSDIESDEYFATRPRGSQIGAWASQQSRPLDQRATLEQRVKVLEQEYQGQSIPRPPHWGGYRLIPNRIEFWQDREFRLHDRILYQRSSVDQPWRIERLYP